MLRKMTYLLPKHIHISLIPLLCHFCLLFPLDACYDDLFSYPSSQEQLGWEVCWKHRDGSVQQHR